MGNFINIDFIHNIISFFISKKNESDIDNNTTNIEVHKQSRSDVGSICYN